MPPHQGAHRVEGKGTNMVHAHRLGHKGRAPDEGSQKQKEQVFCWELVHGYLSSYSLFWLFLRKNGVLVLINMVGRDGAPDAGSGIDVTMGANDCTGIQDTVAPTST